MYKVKFYKWRPLKQGYEFIREFGVKAEIARPIADKYIMVNESDMVHEVYKYEIFHPLGGMVCVYCMDIDLFEILK